MKILLAFVLVCGVVAAGEIAVAKGEITDLDKHFEYISEEVVVDRSGNIEIHGRLKNISDATYDFVMVTITAKDESGSFLARKSANANPLTILPGSASYIDVKLRPNKKDVELATIEWSVTNGRVQ